MRGWAGALGFVAALAVVAIVLTPGASRAPGAGSAHRPHALVAGLYPVRPGPGANDAAPAAASHEIRRLLALGLPIYCGGRHGNEVAFTFDDGPGPYTALALKKLRDAHERATFFIVGRSTTLFHNYLRRELKLAAIGDHTYTHPDLVALSPSEVTSQLASTAQLIRRQSGEHVDLFRPPYEAHNATVDRIARQLGLLEILWSVDSRDWQGADWSQIISIVETGLRPGAIILMHENHGQTIRALTTLLPYLHRHHLRSVSVPELLATDPPPPAQVRRGLAGCGEPPSVLRPFGGLAGG